MNNALTPSAFSVSVQKFSVGTDIISVSPSAKRRKIGGDDDVFTLRVSLLCVRPGSHLSYRLIRRSSRPSLCVIFIESVLVEI